MKFKIFKKKILAQTNAMQMKTKTSHEISKIQELEKKEYFSVSGGPQVENDPSIG